jgi:hypothetical protein
MPGEGESPPVRGGVSAAVKKLWGRLNSAAEGLVLTVGELVSVPFVIMGMTSTKLVTQSGSANLVLAGGNAAFVGFVFWYLVRQMSSEPAKWNIGWALKAAATGVAAASVSVLFFVQLMVRLVHHNQVITLKPAQSELAMKDLYGKAVYEILDAIPILKIPSTLGWEDPIPDPAAAGGIIFLLLKLVVIVALAGLFSKLWVATRKMRWYVRRQGQGEVMADDGDGAGPPGVETAALIRNEPGAQVPEPTERMDDAESDRT